MRPPAPERYVKTRLERLWFARHAAQTTRMVLRQLERRPFKALLTIVGLALAGAIMMMAQLQLNAINYMTDMQYRLAQQQDMTATFTELASRDALGELRGLPGVRRVEGFRAVPVRLRRENHSVQTMIEGLPGDGVLRRPVDVDLRPVPMPASGLLINDFLAQRLGVVVGDRLWVEVLDGELQRFEIPVAQLTREYMGVQAYMELDALNDRLGDGDVLSGASLTVDEDSRAAVARALDKRPRVAGSELRLAAIDAVYKTISQMTDTFTWVAVIMGGVINFGVIYNSARIALAERGRELASLRVLGFTQGEVSYVLLGEQAVLVLLSIPLSFVAGYGLSWFLATNMQSDLYRVPVHVPPGAYAFAALVTIVSALLSALAVRRRIAGLDMIAVLKTRE
jgi:putative ABC transport system permease protein